LNGAITRAWASSPARKARFLLSLSIGYTIALLSVAHGQSSDSIQPLTFIEFTTGHETAAKRPLIIAIHGLGDRPENFARLYRDAPIAARWIIPRAPSAHGRGYSWFPVAIPLRRDDPGLITGVGTAAEKVAALIQWLKQRRKFHGKPIVTGFSQGGMISFMLAARHGSLIEGAVPVAGALPTQITPQGQPKLKVVALHGVDDKVIDYFSALRTVNTFRTAGIAISMHPFPGVGHHISLEMRQLMFEALERMGGLGETKARIVPAAPQ